MCIFPSVPCCAYTFSGLFPATPLTASVIGKISTTFSRAFPSWAGQELKHELVVASAQLQAGSCLWLQYLIFFWRDPRAPCLYGNAITLTWEMFQSGTNVFSHVFLLGLAASLCDGYGKLLCQPWESSNLFHGEFGDMILWSVSCTFQILW